MILRPLFFITLSLVLPKTAVAATSCLQVFIKKQISLSVYKEISLDISETIVKKDDPTGSKTGYVLVTGTYGPQIRDIIGQVDYRIQKNSLRLVRGITKPEYYGQNVFSEMLNAILAKNPNTQSITTVVTGEFYKRYKRDATQAANIQEALSKNPILLQLSRSGFSAVSSATELQGTAPSLLIVVRKPSY